MTSNEESCRIYESAELRKAGDGLIRPGGIELTRSAVLLSELPSGARVLDLGCGAGASLKSLIDEHAMRAVGVDYSAILLREARERAPVGALARATGSSLPFVDAAFDAVLAECSLSVMDDVETTLGECSRVLRNGGLLLAHDVYARAPEGARSLRGLPVRCCLNGAVSKEEWIARLESCGFTLLLWRDHTHALKDFAARLIFSYGSLEAFWGCAQGGPADRSAGRLFRQAVSTGKPGYFFVMAKKNGVVCCKEQKSDG